MTAVPSTARSAIVRTAVPVLLLLGLAGCAGAAGDATPSASPSPSASASADASGPCEEVTLVVDFGTLDSPSLRECVPAGTAAAALEAAGVTTEGTADYGDQVVCRVDDLPSPDVESCATLPSGAYWALWIKPSADGEWDYALEGVATQQVAAGESVGLVYTVGTDSTPPKE